MKLQTNRMVIDLNEQTKSKNVNSSLWELNNELDYFKNVAFKLFEENRALKIQVKLLDKKEKDFLEEKVLA